MSYVTGSTSPPAGCVFCLALRGEDDRRALVLHRGRSAFLILNAFPYASGHLMAVTNRHVGRLEQAAADELIVADGVSCRHQIRDGSGREAIHAVRLLQRVLA
jgi:hypothetical protein